MINLTKKLLIQALDHSASGTLVVDGRGQSFNIVYANHAFTDLTGWDPGELTGRALGDFVVGGEMPAPDASELRQQWRCRGAAPRSLELRVAPLYQRPGTPDYWLLTHEGGVRGGDRRRAEPGRMDPVTGLANRRVFDEQLRRDWGMARRDERRLALLVFEIDAFDAYREVFGRHSEDACLRKVAHAISGALHRAGDFAARLEANRFAVLVAGATAEQAEQFAGQIAARVRRLAIHHPRSPVARFVTVSSGVSSATPARDQGADSLLADALEALLRAPEALTRAGT